MGTGCWGRLRPVPSQTSPGAEDHLGYTYTRVSVTPGWGSPVLSMSTLFQCRAICWGSQETAGTEAALGSHLRAAQVLTEHSHFHILCCFLISHWLVHFSVR